MKLFQAIREQLAARSARRISEPNTIEAAVALVLAPDTSGDALDLLLIKRSERGGDPWSGQMALPGGRREPPDRLLLDTARRETREETGIALPSDSLLGELDDLHPRTRVLPSIVVRPFVFGLHTRPAVAPSTEVALHLWVPLSELRESHTHVDIHLRGQRRREPSYIVGEHVVWGMTHRIITPFIELVA
jgi:8-oxo-dGTP pyrophosphatase MutT (NUDIX family)